MASGKIGFLGIACFALSLGAIAPSAASADEPWLLSLSADVAVPVTEPQATLFGSGGALSGALFRPVSHWLLFGARIRGGLLQSGDPPDRAYKNPGVGTFYLLGLGARLRLWSADDPRRGVGPYLEAVAGPVLTGDAFRVGGEVAVGWGIDLGGLEVAPVLRYGHVFQSDDNLEGRDARLLMVGAELTFFDTRPAPPPPPPPPGDRDLDGLVDPEDDCPDDPEDHDDFEDADGCPDPDNDADGLMDPEDQCPLDPEDVDGFQDEDGCPDPDNDGDRILDVDDRCPNEREVINGVDDQDGCPDEGLIEFVDDRIVLEETVLFDTSSADLHSEAGPVLEAMVALWRQNPGWTQLRIEGHADERGSERANLWLSERRARNVMERLTEVGIPREIITSEGFGSSRPRTQGQGEHAYRANRRVEFVVVSRREVRSAQEEAP